MRTSEQTNELSAALAKAAERFPKIERGCTAKVRTKSGSEYHYDYADLDDVLSAVRKPLAENGLFLSHDCIVIRDQAGVVVAVETTATLRHASGQFQEGTPLFIPCDGMMSPAQLIGSAQTYGKRYTSQNILGVSTEADDDANVASNHDATTGRKPPLPPCPKCNTNKAVIASKPEYGSGYVCWKNKDGCGHQWKPDEPKKTNGEQPDNKPSELEIAMADWKARLDEDPSIDQLNAMLPQIGVLSKSVKKAVWGLIVTRTAAAGLTFDETLKRFQPTGAI